MWSFALCHTCTLSILVHCQYFFFLHHDARLRHKEEEVTGDELYSMGWRRVPGQGFMAHMAIYITGLSLARRFFSPITLSLRDPKGTIHVLLRRQV
jgi:hypothetical protein